PTARSQGFSERIKSPGNPVAGVPRHQDDRDVGHVTSRMTRAGIPTARVRGGTGRVTTALAPTTAPDPTLSRTVAFPPIHTLSPISISRMSYPCRQTGVSVSPKRWFPSVTVTIGASRQLLPIETREITPTQQLALKRVLSPISSR